jgi:hypothetical protein
VLSSARTARMKLVKNDTGTRANGVRILNHSSQEWNRALLAQRSTVFPSLRRESSLRPKHTAASQRRIKGHECEQISSSVVFTPRGLRHVLVPN